MTDQAQSFVMNSRRLFTALAILGSTFAAVSEPPSITRHPSSQIVLLGRAASFEVCAAGIKPIAYK